MKIQKLEEVRKNVHQTHLEDLVLLGKEGFDELYNHIDNFINKLENKGDKINTTVKIDGAPAVVCWHEFPGYPNDSICLKSFINGPEKAKVISSEEELRAGRYADSPKMLDMLSYCLKLAKYIPSGEAWQGDCLFTKDTKEERKINGKNYITFLPNTIIYAFSEDNPGYENIKNADFGIAFHTIYSGSADNLSQSFRVDASRLNLPNNIYVLSPVLNSSTNKEDYGIDEILNLEDQLSLVESDLISDPAYNELANNKEFQTFWGTFENKNYADNKLYQINVDTLIDELNTHLDNRASKMSRVGVGRVRDIINNNKGTLTNMVKALNISSKIKMLLWKGFNSTSKFDYDSFYYNNETGEYIPTTMEGVAMSDDDGNIVKIVDRPTFASNNRNQAFAKGFKHENLVLGEDMRDKGEIVFAFGRMNPPTKGHEKLIRFMGNISAENKPRIYLSHSQDKKRNPLSYEDKINFVKKLAEPEVDVIDTDLRELLYIVVALQQEGFSKITLVCGADRRDSFYNLLLSYNGKTLKNGSMYNFPEENIDVISAGDRDPDSDDPLVKASATNMRNYASNNDFESFKENSPFDGQTTKELFTKVRKGLLLEKLTLSEDEKTKKEQEVRDYYNRLRQDLKMAEDDEEREEISHFAKKEISDLEKKYGDSEELREIKKMIGMEVKESDNLYNKYKAWGKTTEDWKYFSPTKEQGNSAYNEELYLREENTFEKKRSFTGDVDSFATAYKMLRDELESANAGDEVLSQVDSAIDDIRRITNSIDINMLTKLSQRLKEADTGLSSTEFIKLFNPSGEDLNKLLDINFKIEDSPINLNSGDKRFSTDFLNKLINYKSGDKKSSTNIGPYEFALALLFKGGSMKTVGTSAGDISINGENVEVKGVNHPAAIGVDIGENIEILKAFDDYIFNTIENNQKNKTRYAVNSKSYNTKIDKSTLPPELAKIVNSTGEISFEELFNQVFKKVIENYSSRFSYLAVCKKYMVDIIPSSEVADELLNSNKYTVTLADYLAGRFFKIYRKG